MWWGGRGSATGLMKIPEGDQELIIFHCPVRSEELTTESNSELMLDAEPQMKGTHQFQREPTRETPRRPCSENAEDQNHRSDLQSGQREDMCCLLRKASPLLSGWAGYAKEQLDNISNVRRENHFGNLGPGTVFPVEIFFKNDSKRNH